MPLLLWFAFFLADPEWITGTCSLSGTVVDSVTGSPLGKVEVMLEDVSKANRFATATTDAEGRFRLVDIKPGTYRLKGDRNGYLETFYGARRAGRDGITLKLETGQALGDLRLKMFPHSIISGTIRDSDGEPLHGAHVILARRSYSEQGSVVEGIDSTNTDDLGQYRFRVEPGKYYIGAEPRAQGTGKVEHAPLPQGPPEASIPTVYPGVTDAALASPIDVSMGARVMGIDVTFRRSRVFRVTGRVISAGGDLLSPVSLAHRDNPVAIWDYKRHTEFTNSQGDFEFRGVPPGSYTIISGPATLPVEVRAADVEGLRVTAQPAATVSGRIVVEGEDRADLRSTQIYFLKGGHQVWTARVEPDLTFTAEVGAGHYQVFLTGLRSAKFYIASLKAGDVDVLRDGLTLAAGASATLEMRVASSGGTVTGSVVNSEDQPVAGATVVLLPELKLRERATLFRSVTTDQYGQYELPSIPPGDYTLLAWEDVEPFAWNDPDFLKDYEKRGVPIRIDAKGRAAAKLRAIP